MKKTSLILFNILFVGLMASSQVSYDLRDVNGENFVTSVKNQTGGTCWTHGAMAAIEGNLLITGNWETTEPDTVGEPNLAEYHLDWWNGFNEHNNDDADPPTGTGLEVHQGGDYRVTTAYIIRGEGAVFSVDANDGTEKDDNWYATAPDRYDSTYQMFYTEHVEWYTVGDTLENLDVVKQKIIDYGVMGTCLFWGGGYFSGGTHYQPSSDGRDPNHAVAIVGWDDNKVTQATDNGAWIIKNSWGSGWNGTGYFWISYYDKHCGHHPEMGAISYIDAQPLKYEKIYFHDYHGMRDTIQFGEAFNSFTAADSAYLTAVSFYTAADSIAFTAIVFDAFSGNVLQDTLSVISDSIYHSGFHTFELDSAVYLVSGDDFYLYLNLSDGGQPIDRTSEIPVLLGAKTRSIVPSSASAGESYYYDNGTWTDLYNFSFSNSSWDETANLCIKGLVTHDSISWTGLIDSDWCKPGNWEPRCVPEQYMNVFIPSSCTNYPATCNDTLIQFKKLDLDPGSQIAVPTGCTIIIGE